tara:strand:+ start:356 stop:1129 length:774 start_codon:yes stop_codon:yes gene_type:complete
MTYTADVSMFPYFKKEIDYKELYELYEGRAKGMEEELNKIKKLVGIEEDDIPEPNEVLIVVNKLKDENKELKEFKEKAEEECEASAVMEDMMKRIQEAERKEKMWYNQYKNQEPMMDAIKEQYNKLVKAMMKDYNLQEWNYDWDDRMGDFFDNVMRGNTDVDWLDVFSEVGIEYRHYDCIEEEFNDDREIREQYCNETHEDEEDEDWLELKNDIIENSNWYDCDDAFIEWYMNDYRGCKNRWWNDYDGGYWFFEKPN